MKLKCYFKDCKNEWDYKGKNKHYATCTDCMRKVSIKKAKKLMKGVR